MGGGRGGLDVSRLRGLTGVTRLEFADALESAFPSWVELARLLVRLDRKLNQYGAPTQPIGQVAFTVVERAHEEDWLADLVVQADTANPRNTLLGSFVESYRLFPCPAAVTPGHTDPVGPRPSAPDLLQELANVFDDPQEAKALVERAGLKRGRQPGWNTSKAYLFWAEVKREFDDGAVREGGFELVIAQAVEARPRNDVFRDAWQRS